MDCPKCGQKEISGDTCTKCGIIISKFLEKQSQRENNLEASRVWTKERAQRSDEPDNINAENIGDVRIKVRWYAYALPAAIVIFIILFISFSRGNPDNDAQRFMQDLKDGKHLAAQEYLSKDMKQMATFLGGVSDRTLNPYYRTGRIVNFKINLIEKAENSVRYKVAVDCTDGKNYQDTIDFVYEEGKWRVSRF